VEEVQRTRILEAMAEAMAERGAAGSAVTMADVIARAGVSSTAFHEAFADRDACLLAAFDLGVRRARKLVVAAYDGEPRWLDAIKAGLAAFLYFLEDEPAMGRLLVVYATSGGEQVLLRRAKILGALAAAIDRGRLERAAGKRQPPAVIAEGVVGAVLAQESGPVMELFGSLVSIIVLPYLGSGVARRELTRPAPRIRVGPGGAAERAGGPIEHGGHVRLTYRTARVLRAIADYPGASNREVADRAGIVDQGQISKLLNRLEGRGLIVKTGEGRTRGAPNSWCLTEFGEQVLTDVPDSYVPDSR